MHREALELCTRKCIPRTDIKNNSELTIPQKSCFHRCTIKLQEALRFTNDTLSFQSNEIRKVTTPSNEDQPSLMEKLHSIYEEQYGRSAQPVPFKK